MGFTSLLIQSIHLEERTVDINTEEMQSSPFVAVSQENARPTSIRDLGPNVVGRLEISANASRALSPRYAGCPLICRCVFL